MDNDPAPTPPTMPRSSPFEPTRDLAPPAAAAVSPAVPRPPAPTDGAERNGVFGHLVRDDGDIAGLVAYSIYKQNKLDWLRAFEAAEGRVPDQAEMSAYIIGEGTPRRLATYRHLAEATLAGNGPDVESEARADARPAIRAARGLGGGSYASGMIALYGLIAVLFVIGFYLAMHFTASSR